MHSDAAYTTLLGTLRGKLVAFKPGNRIFDEIVAPRDEVFARFRPIFSLEQRAGARFRLIRIVTSSGGAMVQYL